MCGVCSVPGVRLENRLMHYAGNVCMYWAHTCPVCMCTTH